MALPRGINAGANSRISMARLRALFAAAGAENARTYIASGNVAFESAVPPATLRRRFEAALEGVLGYKSVVVVLTENELARVVEHDPFHGTDPTHVAFAADDLDAETIARFGSVSLESGEEAAVEGRQIYFRLPHGFASATIPGAMSKLQPPVTIRSWRTVVALNDLVKGKA